MKRGLFITFEGMDGCGKSTQFNMVKEYFDSLGIDYISTREPGGTDISENIRKIILDKGNTEMLDITEAYLFVASRAQHVREKLIPNLEKGNIVLCDRFLDSNLVYQGYARGLGMDFIANINKSAVDGLEPDLTFLLLLDSKSCRERMDNRGCNVELDRIETDTLEFHERVYEGYMKLYELYKKRIVLIDGSKSIEEIHNYIVKYLDEFLKERNVKCKSV